MSMTPDQIIGIGVCIAIAGSAIHSIAKNNKGVDGYTWGSNGLTWDRPGDRRNPKREQQHPQATAE